MKETTQETTTDEQMAAPTRFLTGQVAIVTGGGRGIGRAVAQELSQAGMAVAVAARTQRELDETVALIEADGGKAVAFPLDVTDRQAVQQMVAVVEDQLGAVDLLINNAGVVTPLGPIWEIDPEAWWHNQEINLLGPFLCAQAVLPSMIARRRGRIINVVSGAGLSAIPYGSAYVVSKTALIRLSENLAVETKEHGVRIFALDPGTTRTSMTDYLYGSEPGQKWTPWFRENFDADRGIVSMEQVMDLLRFLISGQADPLSGRFIRVFDNFDDLVRQAEEIEREDLFTLRLRRLAQ